MAFVERRKRWRLSAGAQREEGVPTASWPSAVGGRPAARCVEYRLSLGPRQLRPEFFTLPEPWLAVKTILDRIDRCQLELVSLNKTTLDLGMLISVLMWVLFLLLFLNYKFLITGFLEFIWSTISLMLDYSLLDSNIRFSF